MKKIPVECQTIDTETGEVTGTKTIDWTLLPAPEGTCPECAKPHEPHMPHDAQALYYQYSFYAKHNRWPTWLDAMAHCSDEMKEIWINALTEMGVDVEGGKITPEDHA